MKTKTKVSFIISISILIIFLFLLKDKLLFEEILLFYFLPYFIFLIPLITFVLIRLLFKKKETLQSFYFKLFIPSALFQILFIVLVIYISSPKYVDKKDAVKDIDFMVRTIEETHPNPYGFISKEQFYSDVEKTKNEFPSRMKSEDFYKTVLKLNAEIKDGHTTADLSYFFSSRLFFYKKIFPYKIKIINDRIIVIGNNSYKDKIPIGSEILKINGIPSDKVIDEASKLISYENNAFRNSYFSMPFTLSIWNNYKDYLVEYKEVNSNETKEVEANGGLFAKFNFVLEQIRIRNPYEFKILQNNIGYIEFNIFDDLNKFSIFLKNTFTTIKAKKINNLIIDIRKNGGGNASLGNELFQYISHKPFKQLDHVELKISKEAIASNIISKADTNKIGSLIQFSDFIDVQLRENPLRFSGNCFLLVGGNTFSSAAIFASTFQCYKMGKIIGSETGGLTVSYGEICFYNLPNSGIVMKVSCKKFYHTCGIDNRRGIIPDYIVENSFKDGQNNFDRVLDYTCNLIINKQLE